MMGNGHNHVADTGREWKEKTAFTFVAKDSGTL